MRLFLSKDKFLLSYLGFERRFRQYFKVAIRNKIKVNKMLANHVHTPSVTMQHTYGGITSASSSMGGVVVSSVKFVLS